MLSMLHERLSSGSEEFVLLLITPTRVMDGGEQYSHVFPDIITRYLNINDGFHGFLSWRTDILSKHAR